MRTLRRQLIIPIADHPLIIDTTRPFITSVMQDFTSPSDGSSQAFPQGSADIKKGRRGMYTICIGCMKHEVPGSGYRFQVCGNVSLDHSTVDFGPCFD